MRCPGIRTSNFRWCRRRLREAEAAVEAGLVPSLVPAASCLRGAPFQRVQALLVDSDSTVILILNHLERQVIGLVTLPDLLRVKLRLRTERWPHKFSIRMAYVTTEDRVDRIEALFGQFLTETAMINRAAEERMSRFENEMAAVHRAAEERMSRFESEMRASKRALDKKWGELADSMGTLIEDMVAPCGFQLARAVFRTEEADTCAIRIRRKHPQRRGDMIELDLLAVGPTQVLVIEAKRRINTTIAVDFRASTSLLVDFFPEYANRRVHCAVASLYLEPSVVTFLNRQQIYGIGLGEETMEVVNLDKF